MNKAATLAAARLTLRLPGTRYGQIIPNDSGAGAAPPCGPPIQPRQQRIIPAEADEQVTAVFLVADAATAGKDSLQIADVIIRTSPARHRRGSRSGSLSDILTRYPGCAVAASGTGRRCAALARAGDVVSFTVTGPPAPAALLCGSLAHCWLVAGWPLATLDGAQLRAVPAPDGWQLRGQPAGAALSFSLRALRRRRRLAASGAPSSS